MGLLDLFRHKKAAPVTQGTHVECPHLVLAARWDSVQDIGNEEKATGYGCAGCGQQFSVEAARELQRKHAMAL